MEPFALKFLCTVTQYNIDGKIVHGLNSVTCESKIRLTKTVTLTVCVNEVFYLPVLVEWDFITVSVSY